MSGRGRAVRFPAALKSRAWPGKGFLFLGKAARIAQMGHQPNLPTKPGSNRRSVRCGFCLKDLALIFFRFAPARGAARAYYGD